jgi:UDP-N-acetylglucosamine--N-acetylmuramyl-(pentapeptide) pyrophosphoryl-undecaprenol N-acetylglucosamine transferase
MKVVITGGHLTPALASIEELKKHSGVEVIFIGRKTTFEGDKTPSAESVIIPQMGIKFYSLTTGRLQRKFTRHTLPSLLKIPYGFAQAIGILREVRPDVVLSFGGYLAVPVVAAASLIDVPVISHEQTVESGLANRIISRLANKIAVSWEESLKHFPAKKVILTGNPVREDLFKIRRAKVTRKVIYITGGNQGSHVINESVLAILPDLLKKYEVIHQTGSSELYKDFEAAKAKYLTLPKNLQRYYRCAKWFNSQELKEILSRTTLLIGRSGANTVCEVAVVGIPAIFVPIPWANRDEQTKNARVLEEIGAAAILPQKELTPKRLLGAIDLVMDRIEEYRKQAHHAKKLVPKDAAKKLVLETLRLVKSESSV